MTAWRRGRQWLFVDMRQEEFEKQRGALLHRIMWLQWDPLLDVSRPD